MLLARIKANKGLLIESEKLCLDAILMDKVDAKAYYLLATVLSEQGKFDKALETLNKTLFLDPDFVLGHFLIGNIFLNENNKTESKKHFNNAIKCLVKLNQDEVLDESDGITAGRLKDIINSIKE